MPAIARMSGTDKVFSPHGTGKKCKFPTTQATEEGSSRVFAGDVGAVRLGDAMKTHPKIECEPHAPTLSNGSTRVFVEGKALARIGDSYDLEGSHPIISGSSRCFSN